MGLSRKAGDHFLDRTISPQRTCLTLFVPLDGHTGIMLPHPPLNQQAFERCALLYIYKGALWGFSESLCSPKNIFMCRERTFICAVIHVMSVTISVVYDGCNKINAQLKQRMWKIPIWFAMKLQESVYLSNNQSLLTFQAKDQIVSGAIFFCHLLTFGW